MQRHPTCRAALPSHGAAARAPHRCLKAARVSCRSFLLRAISLARSALLQGRSVGDAGRHTTLGAHRWQLHGMQPSQRARTTSGAALRSCRLLTGGHPPGSYREPPSSSPWWRLPLLQHDHATSSVDGLRQEQAAGGGAAAAAAAAVGSLAAQRWTCDSLPASPAAAAAGWEPAGASWRRCEGLLPVGRRCALATHLQRFYGAPGSCPAVQPLQPGLTGWQRTPLAL